jgi:TrmH family RNA methyltransferase
MEIITNTQNQKIKELLKLQKAHVRRERKCFIIEGSREISRALESGYEFEDLYFCPSLENFKFHSMVDSFPSGRKYPVTAHVFSRIAYRDNQQGLVAIARMKDHSISTLKQVKNPLYVAVEKLEKPGNLGALLRTADAAGVDAVFVCDNQTDIYNPNVVRSSLGCLFSNKVIISDSAETIDYFKKNNVRILAAALQESEIYTSIDFRQSSAIVLGAEAEGLTETWRKSADHIIRIPMFGISDSLNVSVSAAILIFEAVRQRNE